MKNFKSKYEWFGKGLLSQEKLGLKEEVEYSVIFDLSEINQSELIKIQVKMPGSAIKSPHEIPYENYTLIFQNENINYKIENMLMREWKEVFLYSYSFNFTANKIKTEENNQIDLIEFLVPDLILGYDQMIIDNGQIINYTDLLLNYKNIEYKIKLTGNPNFNNNKQFSSSEAKANFTMKISFDLKNTEYDLKDIYQIYYDLIYIIGLANGTLRRNNFSLSYKDNLVISQKIENNFYDNLKSLALIPCQFSGVLSNYINEVFDKYTNNSINQKKYIQDISELIFRAGTDIILPHSFKKLMGIYHFTNQSSQINLQEKLNGQYTQGDYKIFYSQINYFNQILLEKINYSDKYYDYSEIIPVIKS